MSQESQMDLVIELKVPMKGFCYGYTKALLEKLKELLDEDRVFKNGSADAKDREDNHGLHSDLTGIAVTVLGELEAQVSFDHFGDTTYPKKIKKIMELAEEFLAIFKKKS